MVRVKHAALAAAMMIAMGTPVAAQVLDATYRGTMICDKLPFTSDKMREAIEVTITGGTARYSHVVRLSKVAVEAATEQGTGKVNGQKIDLQGSWKSGSRSTRRNTAAASCGAAPSSGARRPGATAARPSPVPAPARSSGRSGRFCRATRSRPDRTLDG